MEVPPTEVGLLLPGVDFSRHESHTIGETRTNEPFQDFHISVYTGFCSRPQSSIVNQTNYTQRQKSHTYKIFQIRFLLMASSKYCFKFSLAISWIVLLVMHMKTKFMWISFILLYSNWYTERWMTNGKVLSRFFATAWFQSSQLPCTRRG